MDNYDFNALANEVVSRGINMFESFGDWTKGAFALSNLGNDGLPIFNIVSDQPANGTYNLATGGGVFFRVTSEVNYITSFESSDPYTIGTVIVEKDDNGFRMKMAGKLASGPEVAFHIYVPASEWGQLDF